MTLDELIEYYRKKNDDSDNGASSCASNAVDNDYAEPPCKERDYPREDR